MKKISSNATAEPAPCCAPLRSSTEIRQKMNTCISVPATLPADSYVGVHKKTLKPLGTLAIRNFVSSA
ncbi:MAG: DUF3268 family zinc-finger domain-containing protein [Oscillospiraceae bacterium]|nr:DUF3268 family zinc-finger domain-containing protein [Oscillospiraceae bacterium]